MGPETSRTAPPDPSRPWITDLLPADIRWSMLMASAGSPAGVVERMRREPRLLAECLALVTAVPSLRAALAGLGEAFGRPGVAPPWAGLLAPAGPDPYIPQATA